MRLHLECLDWGADDENPPAQFSTVQDETFRGKKIHVDNHQYKNCRFESCHFLYSGGPFAFSECEILACMLGLMGSARWTSKLIEQFVEASAETELHG
jgi:hypothetical protein